jgi:hypothetical protein
MNEILQRLVEAPRTWCPKRSSFAIGCAPTRSSVAESGAHSRTIGPVTANRYANRW